MDYQAAINYLYGLGHETLTMKLGLENIASLAERLGHPESAYPVVHVAGTNGKGSFCAMLAAILAQAAIPAGLYTSPHLARLEERCQFNLAPISEDDFSRLMARIKLTVDKMMASGALKTRPTFFEHITALGLEYFRERAAALAILEVGLGGRLDSTNIVMPALSIITRIDFDHEQYLGSTLAAIAAEKAGILKSGVAALIAPQTAAAAQVIAETARRVAAPLTWLALEQLNYHKPIDGYWSFDFTSPARHYRDVRVGLRGRHQVATAALVILAAEHLAAIGFPITSEQIITGIGAARWPGRLEVMPGAPTILLDGAHNPGGIATLCDFLTEWLAEKSFSPRLLLFSAMRDKDLAAMAQMLFPLFDEVALVERDDPRAANFNDWQSRLSQFNSRLIRIRGARAALDYARQFQQGLAVAAGSLHLIGELKKQILEEKCLTN
jgi:dihydrofolate synthase/folylpolyglutamate synthase